MAVYFDKFNDLAIDHLLADMFEIHGYIFANDRLHLTKSPIRLIRVCHKITEAKI